MVQSDQEVASGQRLGAPKARPALALTALALLLSACGSSPGATDAEVGGAGGEDTSHLPYARSVESFAPGDAAGFNQDELPDIALGPPRGKGEAAGSLDVVSLGAGGEIVLGFGKRSIQDRPGPDFVVFENAFWPGGDASQVYAELAEVSVSEDGEQWLPFPCDTAGDGEGNFPGCAGWTPTLAYDALTLVPLELQLTGGDAFDLDDVGLASARFVKLRDLKTLDAGAPAAGFDLDAVGLLGQD